MSLRQEVEEEFEGLLMITTAGEADGRSWTVADLAVVLDEA